MSRSTSCQRGRGRVRGRGTVLIVALWVTIALTGMVLTLAFSMRTEAVAAANRISQAEAEAAERGVEQWLLSVVDQEQTTPGTISEISMEARQVGNCLTWVVRPDYNNSGQLAYGLADEAAKIDLNTAEPEVLLNLPNMTEDIADAIKDWRDIDSEVTGQGAEDDYYMSLPEPYHCKNRAFESLDELRLVKGVTLDLLYGYDRNQNGIIDNKEATSGNAGNAFNANNDTGVGIAPLVTIYGVQATSTTSSSSSSGSSGSSSSSGSSQPININDKSENNMNQFKTRLTNAGVSDSVANTIVQGTQRAARAANIFDYYFRAGLTQDDFAKFYTQITVGNYVPANGPPPPPTPGATTAAVGKVNINTAPREVLLCLPGLTESDADAIITQRQSTSVTADPTNIAWLVGIIDQNKAATMGGLVTGQSKVFSGDIVALSPDGRAFRRARIVISAASGTAKIIYRRDLTSAGWPLPTEIREAIRSGQGYEAPLSGGVSQ